MANGSLIKVESIAECSAILFEKPLKTGFTVIYESSHLTLCRPETLNLVNTEDPDEMPHYVAFCQGLHCLLRQNRSLEKEIYVFF